MKKNTTNTTTIAQWPTGLKMLRLVFNLGRTCSVVRRTKLLVRLYLLLLTGHPKVVLVTGDLGGLSDQHGSFSQ